MSSKPKTKTYIVLHFSGSTPNGNHTNIATGRYRVGARNEKEAEELTRTKVGKFARCRVYYQDKYNDMKHGQVENDIDWVKKKDIQNLVGPIE